MNISSISPQVYNQRNQAKPSSPSFTGLTNNRAYLAIEERVAKSCVKIVDNKWAKKIIESTSNNKKIDQKLTPHLLVLGSTLLSAFYVGKTLNNKNMDEDKRKTLAVNQALVYGVSTVMAYVFDGWAFGKFNKIFEKFKSFNPEADAAKLAKWKQGFGLARTIIVIDTTYRFIAPVVVTPLANYIGNKLKKNKAEAKKV